MKRVLRVGARLACVGALGWLGTCAALAQPEAASPAATPATASAVPAEATVALHNRRIVGFRAAWLGDTPAERATQARAAVEAAAAGDGPGVVTSADLGDLVRFEVDGATVFFLLPDDLAGAGPQPRLSVAAQQVQRDLQAAVQESREIADLRATLRGAAWALTGTVAFVLLLRGVLLLRRRLVRRLAARLQALQQRADASAVAGVYVPHALQGSQWLLSALSWALVLLLADLWVTFVLRQFAWTRPWGERSTAWLLGLLQDFALAAAAAVPGLLTAALIVLLARLAVRLHGALMQRVEMGDLQLGWLDADTAGPTRRLGSVVIWLFALAMAYPYLPGADSEAFKGVSVLAGLMLTLGATGVVGQATSGLSLMYSRSLRVGEYVKIGEVEGTVTAVGLLATKVHTGLGEEVSLPNAVVVSQPVRNFSRLVDGGQFMLHTAVTIGYATPWRQVHAMLLEAARRTPGVAQQPAPYVVQTALSDFYVEYRLCAQGSNEAPRRRAEAMSRLHAHVQDVFNENGVQIMSPHYLADPPAPQVVPPGAWFPRPAAPLDPPAPTS